MRRRATLQPTLRLNLAYLSIPIRMPIPRVVLWLLEFVYILFFSV